MAIPPRTYPICPECEVVRAENNYCLRENHRPKIESLVLKPITLNLDFIPDLTAVPNFSRNMLFIDQSGIFWSVPMR